MARTVYCIYTPNTTIYHTFGKIPAKRAVCTPYIYTYGSGHSDLFVRLCVCLCETCHRSIKRHTLTMCTHSHPHTVTPSQCAHSHTLTMCTPSQCVHSHTLTLCTPSQCAHSHTLTLFTPSQCAHSHTLTLCTPSQCAHSHTLTMCTPSQCAHSLRTRRRAKRQAIRRSYSCGELSPAAAVRCICVHTRE